jgi:hypothetical protein
MRAVNRLLSIFLEKVDFGIATALANTLGFGFFGGSCGQVQGH